MNTLMIINIVCLIVSPFWGGFWGKWAARNDRFKLGMAMAVGPFVVLLVVSLIASLQ